MDVQTVVNELTDGDPVYAERLSQAIRLVGESGVLGFAARQLKLDFLNQTSMDDQDEQILSRVRETRWQIALLEEVEREFSQIQAKELQDE